jgi:PAS domain S-box-containing protein
LQKAKVSRDLLHELKDDRYYEEIVKAANVVIVRFDKDFHITDFSGSSEKVFGFSREEVIGKFLIDTIVPEKESTGRNLKSLMEEIVRNAGVFQYNINENITKSGRRLWMQWYNSEIKDAQGNSNGILSIGIDISDKIAAENNLKQSEERFRMLSELTFEGIVIHKKGIIQDCNLSFERQTGYNRDELIGHDLFKLLIPEKYHKVMHSRIRERVTRYEAEAVHRNGRIIPIMIEANDTIINNQRVRVVAVRDISEQKMINEGLKKAQTELTTLKKVGHEVNRSITLSQVTKASIEGIMNVIKPDLAMIFLRMGNDLMIQDYDTRGNLIIDIPYLPLKSFSSALTRSFTLIDVVKDTENQWESFRRSGLRSVGILPMMQNDDLMGIIVVGAAKKQNFRKHQLFIETIANETSIGIQNAMLYDQVKSHAEDLEELVTERTKKLNETVERLKELDKLKSIFLASMSHELRTPLNSIIGYTGILMMGMTGQLNDEQIKQLGKVKSNARHLLGLINEILDISKIEAGKIELFNEEISIANLIRDVSDTLHPKAIEKGIQMNLNLPYDFIIKTDQRRLTQVLLNLAGNAVNYTNGSSVEIKAVRIPHNRFRLSVIDSGPGITSDDMRRLFQPFQQIDSSLTKKNKGTGLGLYLCRRLMTVLGGEVDVKSKPGKGSEFFIEMPQKTG